MLAMPDEAKAALLLDSGAKPTGEALEIAAGYHGTESIVRRLLLVARMLMGRRSLAAVAAGNAEVAGVLFDGGARLSAEQSGTALSNAVMSDDARMLRLLAQRGVPLNGFDEAGLTPLMVAAIMHRNDIVRELLELGAKPEVTDKNGQTARDHAADIWYMDTKTAELLAKPTACRAGPVSGCPTALTRNSIKRSNRTPEQISVDEPVDRVPGVSEVAAIVFRSVATDCPCLCHRGASV